MLQYRDIVAIGEQQPMNRALPRSESKHPPLVRCSSTERCSRRGGARPTEPSYGRQAAWCGQDPRGRTHRGRELRGLRAARGHAARAVRHDRKSGAAERDGVRQLGRIAVREAAPLEPADEARRPAVVRAERHSVGSRYLGVEHQDHPCVPRSIPWKARSSSAFSCSPLGAPEPLGSADGVGSGVSLRIASKHPLSSHPLARCTEPGMS
jgi:hypothetical protein